MRITRVPTRRISSCRKPIEGPDNQRLISLLLKKTGAEITVAENEQLVYDLVLASATAAERPGVTTGV